MLLATNLEPAHIGARFGSRHQPGRSLRPPGASEGEGFSPGPASHIMGTERPSSRPGDHTSPTLPPTLWGQSHHPTCAMHIRQHSSWDMWVVLTWPLTLAQINLSGAKPSFAVGRAASLPLAQDHLLVDKGLSVAAMHLEMGRRGPVRGPALSRAPDKALPHPPMKGETLCNSPFPGHPRRATLGPQRGEGSFKFPRKSSCAPVLF